MAEMMPQSALVPDSDYIIIGGTGDLALRKIFPALFWRFLEGQITSSFRLIAAARQESSKQDFAERLRPFCEEALSHADTKDADFEAFLKLIHLVRLDILSGEGADALATLVHDKAAANRPCIFYLAVAP
ncbi:MAG: glucose-6-phosphate dehydrogenase, partial [Rhodospirillaceae bacterium]|nr:glucose-6-phosphate dehydrogenase [Rhodospirillaceae bacterium]